MVLLPAPAGPSMAMMSLRWEGAAIGSECAILHGSRVENYRAVGFGGRGLPFSRRARGAAWERRLVSAESPGSATCCRHARSSIRAPITRHELLPSPVCVEQSLRGSFRLRPHPLLLRSPNTSKPALRALPAPKSLRLRARLPAPSATVRPTPNLPPPCNRRG